MHIFLFDISHQIDFSHVTFETPNCTILTPESDYVSTPHSPDYKETVSKDDSLVVCFEEDMSDLSVLEISMSDCRDSLPLLDTTPRVAEGVMTPNISDVSTANTSEEIDSEKKKQIYGRYARDTPQCRLHSCCY